MNSDRRSFIALAAAAPIAALAATRALGETPACYDSASLSLSQQRFRKSVQFANLSPDAAKHCQVCAFFKAGQPGCGSCQILNGPVSAGSWCSSFATKAK